MKERRIRLALSCTVILVTCVLSALRRHPAAARVPDAAALLDVLKVYAVVSGLSLALIFVAMHVRGIAIGTAVKVAAVWEPATPPTPSPLVYVEAFAIYALMAIAVEVLWPGGGWGRVAIGGAPACAGVLWCIRKGALSWKGFWRDVGFCGGRSIVVEMALGACAFVVLSPLIVTAGMVVFADPTTDIDVASKVAMASVLTLVIAPATEEIMYRGILYRGVAAMHGVMVAILVTSLLFMCRHDQWPRTLFFAVACAVLRRWRGGVIAPIMFHLLSNVIPTYFLWSIAA